MRRKLNCFLAYLLVALQMVNPVFLCADDSSVDEIDTVQESGVELYSESEDEFSDEEEFFDEGEPLDEDEPLNEDEPLDGDEPSDEDEPLDEAEPLNEDKSVNVDEPADEDELVEEEPLIVEEEAVEVVKTSLSDSAVAYLEAGLEELSLDGWSITEAFDLSLAGDVEFPYTVVFNTSDDYSDEDILLLHQKHDDSFEIINPDSVDGTEVTATFSSLSPVAVLVQDSKRNTFNGTTYSDETFIVTVTEEYYDINNNVVSTNVVKTDTVNYGDDYTYKALYKDSYDIVVYKLLFVDCYGSVWDYSTDEEGQTYTFNNITDNLSIKVKYTRLSYSIYVKNVFVSNSDEGWITEDVDTIKIDYDDFDSAFIYPVKDISACTFLYAYTGYEDAEITYEDGSLSFTPKRTTDLYLVYTADNGFNLSKGAAAVGTYTITVIDKYLDSDFFTVKQDTRISEETFSGETYTYRPLEELDSGYVYVDYECNKTDHAISFINDTGGDKIEINGALSSNVILTFIYRDVSNLKYNITVTDTYLDIYGNVINSELRESVTLNYGSKYSYSALSPEGYTVVSYISVSGSATEDVTITFKYRKTGSDDEKKEDDTPSPDDSKNVVVEKTNTETDDDDDTKTYTVKVIDNYYSSDGTLQSSSIRLVTVVSDGSSYCYSAVQPSGYEVSGANSYIGTVTGDLTLVFSYVQAEESVLIEEVVVEDADGGGSGSAAGSSDDVEDGDAEYTVTVVDRYLVRNAWSYYYTANKIGRDVGYSSSVSADGGDDISVTEVTRQVDVYAEGSPYSYGALNASGYKVVGESTQTGVVDSDLTLVFVYAYGFASLDAIPQAYLSSTYEAGQSGSSDLNSGWTLSEDNRQSDEADEVNLSDLIYNGDFNVDEEEKTDGKFHFPLKAFLGMMLVALAVGVAVIIFRRKRSE